MPQQELIIFEKQKKDPKKKHICYFQDAPWDKNVEACECGKMRVTHIPT